MSFTRDSNLWRESKQRVGRFSCNNVRPSPPLETRVVHKISSPLCSKFVHAGIFRRSLVLYGKRQQE